MVYSTLICNTRW